MISWTTAREVPFEVVCTMTTSNNAAYSETGGDLVNLGEGNTFSRTTLTLEGGSGSEFSSGGTTNQEGYTTSFSSSYSASGLTNVYYTYSLYDTAASTTVSSSFASSASFSTEIISSSSDSFSYSGFPAQTTTQTTLAVAIATTSSSSFEYTAKTTSLETYTVGSITRSSTVFVDTSTTLSTFYAEESGSTIVSQTVATTDGSTQGNVFDTIYQAGTGEVLWSIGDFSQYYQGALTNGAASGTQFTASASVAIVEIVTTDSDNVAQTIQSSQATSLVSYRGLSQGSILQTTAEKDINAETSENIVFISSNSAVSSNLTVSGQGMLEHFGNTSTAPMVSYEVRTANRTDLLGSASHQIVWLSSKIGTNTIGIGNLLGSGCAGNTTVSLQKVIGTPAIASPPYMTVYSPAGAAIGDKKGVRFTAEQTADLVYAKDGIMTLCDTIMPVSFSLLMISSDSVTFIDSESSSKSMVVGVDGDPWRVIARQRGDGLVGGNLGQSETGLMRFNPGLYKDQNGAVSFFSGNDITYSGSASTTFWEPISYVVPGVGNDSPFAVPRNTSTWPTD